MNISYENEIHLAFDEPLEYKELLLYPATVRHYSLFNIADECLDAPRFNEKDINLLRLPYLEYIYEKSKIDSKFEARWNLLICILNIVLGEKQPFEIIKKDKRIYIKVYQKSDNYELLNKEYTALEMNFLKEHKEKEIGQKELSKISEQLTTIQDKMYNIIEIGSEDFENIRYLIMLQNDIKSQHFDLKTEKLLYEAKEKMAKIKKSNDKTDFEDLVRAVAYSSHKTMQEIKKMTIRGFNRELHYIMEEKEYYIYRLLDASGMIKLKKGLQHWINHYEPRGKFDDVLIDSEEFKELYGNNKTI